MKTKKMRLILMSLLVIILPLSISGQTDPTGQPGQTAQPQGRSRTQKPPDDISKWTNKTIMWIGAHPDDETLSYGTLSMLKANGNKIIMVWYTTGNKGSRDLTMTSERLAQIRKAESEKAMGELGISPATDTFIWFGYPDGMLEYVPALELTEKICRVIRQYHPDAVFSFDPGSTNTRWHKTDHRASAFITVDGVRAAAYFLYFPSQFTHEGLQPHTVRDFFFYDSRENNYQVDVTGLSEKRIRARAWYVSQFGQGNIKYSGPELDQTRLNNLLKTNTESMAKGDKVYENFRRLTGSMSF